MAVLSDADRVRVWRGAMRYWTSKFETLQSLLKADLRAAVNATDNWIDDNQASYNTALPEPFKSNATLEQKTLLFCLVALARVGIGFLRSIVGEVD